MGEVDNKVVQFVKLTDNDRIEKGKELIDSGSYLRAISSLLPILDNGDKKMVINSAKFLANAYFLAGNSKLTLLFNFLYKETDLFMSNVYLKVAHTYLKTHDYEKALSYFKRAFEEDDTFDDLAEEIIDMIYNSRKGFKVISNDINDSKDLLLAEKLVASGHFEEAIEEYEKLNDLNNERVRNGLSFAYMFLGESDKALSIMKEHGRGTILDLCNLLILYYLNKDTNNYDRIGQILSQKKKNLSVDEKFKVGLAYAETNNFNAALNYMSHYKDSNALDLEASLYYAITCINAGKFKQAKAKLLDLYNFDYFNRYIYMSYLDICERKIRQSIKYFFDVPFTHKKIVRQKVKDLINQDDEYLKCFFRNNKPFFFYLAKHNNSFDNANLTLRLACFQEDDFYLFTRFLLLSEDIGDNFKLKVLYNMICFKYRETNAFMSIVFRGYYYNFELPDMDFYSEFVPGVREVIFNTIEFFLKNVEPCKIDITTALSQIVWGMKGKSRVVKLRDKAKMKKEKSLKQINIMSSVLTYKILDMMGVKDFFRDVLQYYKVSQKDFYFFIDKNHIEI